MKYLSLLCAGAALLLAGCAQYAVVKERKPALPRHTGAERLAGIIRTVAADPAAAMPDLLQTASEAADTLKVSPADEAALQDYNFAVARIFTALRAGGLDPWTRPLVVSGGWTLSANLGAHRRHDPLVLDFQPTDNLEVQGSYVETRTIRAGLGAPLVVISRAVGTAAADPFTQAKNAYYGGTAVARFRGRRCDITVEDPLESETVSFAGRRFPLAGDFTAPLAMALAEGQPRKLEWSRLLNPQKYSGTARLARLQPYNPDKIPVICVHGLMDSEATWVPLINSLRGDPEIRKRYQFWFFSYPSGYPYPLSASILRQKMDGIDVFHPGHKKAVLIGHSMGGMISRLMLTDSGDKLWKTMFGKPPGETPLSDDARKVLEPALIFRHRTDISRVIFIAAPHRGADLAKNWIGRLGSKLVKPPSTLLGIGSEVVQLVQPQPGALEVKSVPNSVDTLASNNRFVKAVNTLPLARGIPYHSIMGDRGKGDTPESSDGFVPYWSSHLDGAASEKIVPSDHSVQQNPEAIEEVKRILRMHR